MRAARQAPILLALACLLVGGASASEGYGYFPSTCNLVVSVVADEAQPSWFDSAPEIRGSVTLSNPNTFGVPISSIVVQARSSDGLIYSALATCGGGGSSTLVPFNRQPGTYGSARCSYRIVLDRRVFGSYGDASSASNGYFYFPSHDTRPSWTVTAIATVSINNAQCLSAPFPVQTECWWTWLQGWYRAHHPSLRVFIRGVGRKLLGAASASTLVKPSVVVAQAPVASVTVTKAPMASVTVTKAPVVAVRSDVGARAQVVVSKQAPVGPGPWGVAVWEQPAAGGRKLLAANGATSATTIVKPSVVVAQAPVASVTVTKTPVASVTVTKAPVVAVGAVGARAQVVVSKQAPVGPGPWGVAVWEQP